MGRAHKVSASAKSSPNTRDSEATKLQILDAAEIEFARQGLHGTRVDPIAKRAGVAPRMIYYYFENKEDLYKAVLQRPAQLLHTIFQQLDLNKLPPEKALSSLIRASIEYETSNRCRGMLLFQEAIQNQGKFFKLISWQEPISLLVGILERGVALGVFKELNVQMTTLNIIGICTLYANAYENIKHLNPEQDLLSEKAISQYIESATQLVLNGIKSNVV